MSKIGIIFAMKEEIQAVLKKIELIRKYKVLDLDFYECTINNNECILVQCGIGKVNSARTAQILIDKANVDLIINVGVAGAVDECINVGDIVIADRLVQHDFDLTSFGREKGYIPDIGKYIKCDERLVDVAKNIDIAVKKVVGTIASGDIFVSGKENGEKINKEFGALCVEMEGAAMAQIAYLSKVPFIVIRSISDSPNQDEKNKLTFEKFLEKNCEIVSEFLIKMIDKLY